MSFLSFFPPLQYTPMKRKNNISLIHIYYIYIPTPCIMHKIIIIEKESHTCTAELQSQSFQKIHVRFLSLYKLASEHSYRHIL